ncbi:MAG: hypothetical protein ACI32C_02135 [Candidatus Enteromonas sp.]
MLKKLLICLISALSLSITNITLQPRAADSNLHSLSQQKQEIIHKKSRGANSFGDDQNSSAEALPYDERDTNLSQYDVDEANLSETRSADAIKDQYEYNDTIIAAKIISPTYDGTYSPTSYSVSLDATLHRNEWLWGLIKREVDVDYYEFQVYGKADVTIELSNIPSGCDYDMGLFEHSNDRYTTSEDVNLIDIGQKGSNQQEKISKLIFPGIYYIKVYSFNDSFNAQEEYHLSLDVNYRSENISISNLRYVKGVGAALWVSDYDPFKIQPFTSSGRSEVGYITSSEYYTAFKFGNPIFEYIRDGGKILHASLYIWDLGLRRQLYEIVKDAIEILKTEIGSKEKIKATFNVAGEMVNDIFTVTGIGMTFVPTTNTSAAVSFAVDAVASLVPSLLSCICEAIMPESKIDEAKDYLSYLQVLEAALECNSSTSDQEVVRIDSSYDIKLESVPGIIHTNYDIDFTPTIQDRYLYDSDTITSFSSEAKFNGTVYPLKTLDDIQKARLKNQNPVEDVNTGGDTELVLDQSVPNQLSTGEYHWYHFVAPETATYEFKTDSSIDTYGELFSSVVPGKSTEGILSHDDDGDFTNGTNFSLKYNLFEGRKVYLRVRGYGWKFSGLYSVSVSKANEITPIIENINGADFGFQNEYVDNENRTSISLDSGFSFTTQRIRCGYINNQYLALSAKCKDAGTAYLQMDFVQDINAFNFGIAIWSGAEYLNTKSSIVLETKSKDGVYNIFYQFNISGMSKDKDVLDLHSFTFPEETYGIRIRVNTNQVNYEKNKGRVVLGDMSLIHLA